MEAIFDSYLGFGQTASSQFMLSQHPRMDAQATFAVWECSNAIVSGGGDAIFDIAIYFLA